MDALGDLEDIISQSAYAGNVGTKKKTGGGHSGWGISPNLSRARVKPKTKAKREPRPPCESPAPAAVPTRAKLGRPFNEYRTLIETCRARADELALSRSEIDRLGGLPSGYAGKLLGKAAVDDVSFPRKKSSKRMWPVALEAMLGVLGLKILLIEDDAATARTLALRTPVDRSNQRFGNVCRISARLLEKPAQPAPPALLAVVGEERKRTGSKYGR